MKHYIKFKVTETRIVELKREPTQEEIELINHDTEGSMYDTPDDLIDWDTEDVLEQTIIGSQIVHRTTPDKIVEMRLINVLEIINGVPSQIESFPIWEEQLSGEIIEEAEKFFIELCKAGGSIEFTDEEIEYLLDEGNYDDQNGHEVYIIWSN